MFNVAVFKPRLPALRSVVMLEAALPTAVAGVRLRLLQLREERVRGVPRQQVALAAGWWPGGAGLPAAWAACARHEVRALWRGRQAAQACLPPRSDS